MIYYLTNILFNLLPKVVQLLWSLVCKLFLILYHLTLLPTKTLGFPPEIYKKKIALLTGHCNILPLALTVFEKEN